MTTRFHVGCAGWSTPKQFADQFTSAGSQLQRYSARLNAVEINSSFYRPHRPTTYSRWAETVPAGFRFSVKMSRSVTHDARLLKTGKLLDRFFFEVSALGRKLGCVLIQLPPSLLFDPASARRFLTSLRHRFSRPCALEARHASWFDEAADAMLEEFRVGRVAADPAVVPAAAKPGGASNIAYYRLHGSPSMYYSDYGRRHLEELANLLRTSRAKDVWCVFDNTALGAATGNALDVRRLLSL